MTTNEDTSFSRARLIALVAMLSSAGAVGAGLSLGLPLLSFVLESRGISGSMIGLNTAVAGLSTFIAAPLATPLARRFGSPLVLILSLIVAAITLTGFYFIEAFWAWFPLRLVFHCALGFAFIVSEFWINTLAPDRKRGLIIGIYATMLSMGFSVGPLILAIVGSKGFAPFAIGAAILAVSAIPILFAQSQPPALHDSKAGSSVLRFLKLLPMAMGAVLVFGAVESGALAILPVYGLRIGFDERSAALLITATALGNVALQIPIGVLSDRLDRVFMLRICALVGLAGAVTLPFLSGNLWLVMPVLFIWGGVTAGLYTIGLSLIGATYSGASLASANAAFVLMYSVGMLFGPITIGAGLDIWNPHGAPAVMAAFFLALVFIVFYGPRPARET